MIIQADILKWAETYDGPKFHAALMDAPYEMEFMGKGWDATGVAFDPKTWEAIARHLYPGAFLFVCAGTINDDLISVAMRQAGLRKYHKCAYWGFGSGFPKATDLPSQIDEDAFVKWLEQKPVERDIIVEYRNAVQATRKAYKAGQMPRAAVTAAHNAYRAKRLEIKAAAGFLKTVGTKRHQPKFAAAEMGYREKDNGFNSKERETYDVAVPATAMAQTWDGYSYGGQVIKPAVETILIFQKMYEGRTVDSITATGAGALWIDGGRIGTGEDKGWSIDTKHLGAETTAGIYGNGFQRAAADRDSGRWPANLVLSHSPSCNGHCAPECAVRRLGEQSGESASKRSQRGTVEIFDELYKRAPSWHGESTERGHDDSGTAARFFFQSDYMYERLEDADPVAYFAKASKGEREAGLDPRQLALLQMAERDEATINDGRDKPIDNPYQRGETTRRNIHPTIKPIALARHLATLLLPPDAYAPRRLLVPFAGAGSEMCGALLAGWEEIVGVELEQDHVEIARARLAYWKQRLHEFGDPAKEVRAALSEAPKGQMELF